MRVSESWPTVGQLLSFSNKELAAVDPIVLNLSVAKEVPSLRDLDIGRYVRMADEWAGEIQRCLPITDANFQRTPELWQNDLDFSRLATMCWHLGTNLDIRYREGQRTIKEIWYTDPNDVFLCGVIDTRRGTCGNMASLYVAVGWPLGWPVSLASMGSHFILRFDDGKKVFNIEATNPGEGGTFCAPPDKYYVEEYRLPKCAIECGSELRAVTPREMLGLFVGLRGRHLRDIDRRDEAEQDYLLARYLFPKHRNSYISQSRMRSGTHHRVLSLPNQLHCRLLELQIVLPADHDAGLLSKSIMLFPPPAPTVLGEAQRLSLRVFECLLNFLSR